MVVGGSVVGVERMVELSRTQVASCSVLPENIYTGRETDLRMPLLLLLLLEEGKEEWC